MLQMQPLPVHLSPLSVGLNHITHKIERVRVSEEEANGPRRSFNCGPPTSCRRRRRGRGERGGRREGSERRSAASSTVGGRERGRGGRGTRGPRTSTVDLHGWRTDRTGAEGGRGPYATSDSSSGKVAARVDCNWFIIINDDLLYGMETVFV